MEHVIYEMVGEYSSSNPYSTFLPGSKNDDTLNKSFGNLNETGQGKQLWKHYI